MRPDSNRRHQLPSRQPHQHPLTGDVPLRRRIDDADDAGRIEVDRVQQSGAVNFGDEVRDLLDVLPGVVQVDIVSVSLCRLRLSGCAGFKMLLGPGSRLLAWPNGLP